MAFRILTSLLLLSCAAALDDQSALLQMSVGQDACTCLNWKKAYADKQATCGEVNEYFFAYKARPPDAALAKTLLGLCEKPFGSVCTDFYQRIDDNFCLKVNVDAEESSWCYVSPACKSATKAPLGALSWKMCKEGQDKTLRNFTLPQLQNLSTSNDVELRLLTKLVFPTPDVYWEDVKSHWRIAGKKLSVAQSDEMKRLTDSGKPYFFNVGPIQATSPDGMDVHASHVIAIGSKAYMISPQRHPAGSGPSTWQSVKCVTGCGR